MNSLKLTVHGELRVLNQFQYQLVSHLDIIGLLYSTLHSCFVSDSIWVVLVLNFKEVEDCSITKVGQQLYLIERHAFRQKSSFCATCSYWCALSPQQEWCCNNSWIHSHALLIMVAQTGLYMFSLPCLMHLLPTMHSKCQWCWSGQCQYMFLVHKT